MIQTKLDIVIESFSKISIYTPDIEEKGESNKLLKMLSPIYSIKNVDAKIRRLISILHSLKTEKLCFNSEITQIKLKEKKDKKNSAYESLKDLETRIRTFLEEELGKKSVDWWNQCIPIDVRENAEIRKNENERPWPWFDKGEKSKTGISRFQ